jgi:hypothetical protein
VQQATVVARSWVRRFRMMILSVDASIEQATWHALGRALSGAAKNAELVDDGTRSEYSELAAMTNGLLIYSA